MDALVRSGTCSFSRRFGVYYDRLVQQKEMDGGDYQRPRSFSRRIRKEGQSHSMSMKSFSYRRKRAKQRRIFLKTYTLASIDNSGQSRPTQKLKRAVFKVKTAVLSIAAFLRIGALRSCNSSSKIEASSPTPTLVTKFF